jgi:UDP-glucose 4-epimerase
MFNKERGTRVNNVRVVNAYGPRQMAAAPYGPGKVRKITPAFVCRALTGQPIEVYGDGNQVSDMVYVTDVAQALVTALEKAEQAILFPKAVEVGPKYPGFARTVNDIARLIIEVCVEKGFDEVELKHLPMRPGETPGAVVVADAATLEWVDMVPEDLVSLRTGMEETVDYFIEYLGVKHG